MLTVIMGRQRSVGVVRRGCFRTRFTIVLSLIILLGVAKDIEGLLSISTSLFSWKGKHSKLGFPLRKCSGLAEKISDNHKFIVSCIQCFSFTVLVTWLAIFLTTSGDIHPNPGPISISYDSLSTSSICSSDYSKANISVFHLNIQSLLSKIDILEVELQPYDIVVLTETWLKPSIDSDQIVIPNFHSVFRRDRPHRLGGGVAIYVKNTIPCTVRADLDIAGLESLSVEVNLNGSVVLIVGIYRPPNVLVEYWIKIEELFDRISTTNIQDVIIMGDFNTDISIPSNKRMLNIAELHGYNQLINQKTYYSESSSSTIDLLFAKHPINVVNCQVLDPFIEGLSRFHCPIFAELRFTKKVGTSFTRKVWQYEQGDYDEYRRILSVNDWAKILSTNDLNEATVELTSIILSAAASSIPNKIITIRPKEPLWITNEIKRKIRQRKRLFRAAKRHQDEYHWTKFKQTRNEVVKLIRNIKLSYYSKLASKLNEQTTSSKSWYKIVKQFLSKTTQSGIPPLVNDNYIAETNVAKCNFLNDYFLKQTCIKENNVMLTQPGSPAHPLLGEIHITTTDICDAISVLEVSKASGPDGISPRLIKEAKHELLLPLQHIFNMSLQKSVFPDGWKKANVVPIFKNKGNPTDPNNYRPISLLNVLAKLMEKCVHKHLFNYFREYSVITSAQSGFIRGDSTTNQLLYLYDFICKCLDQGSEIRIVFCDISKAFDRVWHKGLLHKLSLNGVTGTILSWLKNYLHNRKQRVCYEGAFSDWSTIKAGVPQGSILGPLLFIIYINDIVSDISSNIRLFADDTSVYVKVDNPTAAASTINSDLEKIKLWSQKWLVSFNPTKTESLVITKKRNKTPHPSVYFDNTIIKEVSEHKHLGLIISNNGQWKEHIEYISQNARKRLAILRSVQFKLDRATLEKIYISFIRPLLEYADVIWDNCSLENKKYLESLHLEAARIITGATRYCNNDKLYKELGWETLQNRRDFHKLSLFYNIVNNATPSFLSELVPPQVRYASRYPLRNANNIVRISSRTNLYSESFLPSTVRQWNALSSDVSSLPSLSAFRRAIKTHIEMIPTTFKSLQTNRPGQIYHTRLRLGCSSLNYDLFRRNLILSPRCSCGQVETTEHFLLLCDKYTELRNKYIIGLPCPLTVNNLTRGDDGQSLSTNNSIFKNVQLYILNSKRFSNTALPTENSMQE